MSAASSSTDPIASAVDYCESLGREQLADLCSTLTDALQRKLWHQLTVTVLEAFVAASMDANTMLGIYQNVILTVESKLDVLMVAQIAALVAERLVVSQGNDATAAKTLLQDLISKYSADTKEDDENHDYSSARWYLQSKLMLMQLQPLVSSGSGDNIELLATIKALLKKNATALQNHHNGATDTTSSAMVHAAHYEASMTYYKLVGPPELFVQEAMNYLTYHGVDPATANTTNIKDTELAIDLIVAALVGQGVYNLTQIVQAPIVQVLRESPSHAWLVELLQATADGNVVLCQSLSQQYAAQIATQPALVNAAQVVQEKLTLLALVHLVFDKPSNERTLSFEEIAARLHMSDNVAQVEWVIMRALSVKLLEGSMDQVEQTLQVTWVLPRVLTNVQMTALAGRFGTWADKVTSMKELMQTTVEAAF